MANQERRRITIDTDGRATYAALRVAHTADGSTQERVTRTKSADVRVLFPEERGLFLRPRNCILEDTVGGVTLIVIEDRPTVHTVDWRLDAPPYTSMRARLQKSGMHQLWGETAQAFARRLATQERFALAFPYLVKFYRFLHGVLDRVFLFYRASPITQLHDELAIPNLPNREQGKHQLCLPELSKTLAGQHLSIREYVERVELEFWGSIWNADWCEDFFAHAHRIPEIGSPWEWERHSRERPRFMCELPWALHERTLMQEFRYRMQESTQTSPVLFDALAQQICAADDFDVPVQPVSESSVVPMSTTQLLAFGAEVVRVGDALVMDPGVCAELPGGGTGRVTGLSRLVRGQRYAQLESITAPVRITDGAALRPGVRIVPATLAPSVRYMGVPIVPGTVVRFLDAEEWPDRTLRDYVIQTVRCDATHVVHAQFRDDDRAYVVLGTIAAPSAGFRCFPSEEIGPDGMCRANEITLTDGTVIRNGTEWFRQRSDGQIEAVIIRGILPLGAPRIAGRCIRDGNRDAVFRIDDASGARASTFLPRPPEPIVATEVQGRTVRCGDRLEWDGRDGVYVVAALSPVFPDGSQAMLLDGLGWVMLAIRGRWHERVLLPVPVTIDAAGCVVGEQRYPIGLVCLDREARRCVHIQRYVAGRNGELLAECSSGERRVLLRRGVRTPSLLPIAPMIAVGEFRLCRGTRIRFHRAAGDAAPGVRDTVLGIVEDEAGSRAVVLVSGRVFALTPEQVACIDIRIGTTWSTMDGSALATDVRGMRPAHSGCFRQGDRVYAAGDRIESVPADATVRAAIARTPGTIDTKDGEWWQVRLDRAIPELGALTHYWAHRSALVHAFPTYSGTCPPFLAHPGRSRARCLHWGASAGSDAAGRALRVGDRVRALHLREDSTVRAHELYRQGHWFTIVHAVDVAAAAEPMLYLSAGVDVGQRPLQNNLVRRSNLPEAVATNPRWWASICFAAPHECDRVSDDAARGA